MSPLSQTAMPKDNEAPLPTSSLIVPWFKEALLPSSPKEKEASTLPTSPVKVMPQQDLGHQEQDLPPSSPHVPKFMEASLLSSPKEKGSFYITSITYQGYALAGPRPPGTRSTTVISLQHNPPGIRPVQPKYPFRPSEQVL
jgi:hypothetical protein